MPRLQLHLFYLRSIHRTRHEAGFTGLILLLLHDLVVTVSNGLKDGQNGLPFLSACPSTAAS